MEPARISKILGSSLVAALAALVLACGGGGGAAAPSTPRTPVAADDPSCPVTVPGTSVTVEDTATGAALVFVTTGDAAELRRRVAAMAAMHNDHHGAMGPLPTGDETGGGHDHAHHAHGGGEGAAAGGEGAAGGGEHAGHAGGMIAIHSKASAEDVDGGARLVFVVAPGDVAAMGDELRGHARHLASGTCAME